MEVVLQIETKNYQKVKEILLKDDLVSRASIMFREGKIIDKEGYFCYISGTEEQYKKAKELTKDLVKEAEEKDKEQVIVKIKEEEEKASESMGSLFG